MYTRLINKATKAEVKISISKKGNKTEVSSHYYKWGKKDELLQNKYEIVFLGGLKEALDMFYALKLKRLKQNFAVLIEKDLGSKIAYSNQLVSKNKKPVKYYNHVGVEIEFISPYSRKALAQILKKTRIEKYVNLKEDVTLSPDFWGNSPNNKLEGFYAHELNILVKEHEITLLHEILEFLKVEAKARVNNTCGLHVHLDMRHRDVKDCYKNLVDAQDWMFKINPERKNYKYCKRNKIADFDKARDKYRDKDGYWNRFLAVNPHAYEKFKTLEVRVHKGSLDSAKIVSWVKFLIKVCDGKTEGGVKRVSGLQKRFKLTKTQVQYLQKET